MTLGGFTSDVVRGGTPQMGGLTSADVAPEGAYGIKVGSTIGFVVWGSETNHRVTQMGTVTAIADQSNLTVENEDGTWELHLDSGDSWGLMEEPT